MDELLETLGSILAASPSSLLLSRLYHEGGRLIRVEKLPMLLYGTNAGAQTLFKAHIEHDAHWAVDVLPEAETIDDDYAEHVTRLSRLRRAYVPLAQRLLEAAPRLVELVVQNNCFGEEACESISLILEPTLTLTVL